MKRFILLLGLAMITHLGYSQSLTTATFTESTADFPNPERGFYVHTQTHASTDGTASYQPLTATELQGYVTNNMTLILRIFYIHDHVLSSTIPASYIAQMQTDFDLLRANGLKAIVRFAYANVESELDNGATAANIDSQLASLQSVLSLNEDVVLAVQAGFIGTWGEWYYTSSEFGNAGVFTETQLINRYSVITSLLNYVPSSIPVQIRETKFKRFYLDYIGETTTAISKSEAFDLNTAKARLGHHNDCILSEPDLRIHEVTIPKASIGLTGVTGNISLGYRAMDGTILWNNGDAYSQLPLTADGMASYTLGTYSTPTDWDVIDDIVPFPTGAVPEFKVADDATNLYVRVKESGYMADGKDRYEIFLNTDDNTSTGWIDATAWTNTGADYYFSKDVTSTTNPSPSTTLYTYSGTTNDFTFTAGSSLTAALAYDDAYSDRGTYSSESDLVWTANETFYVMSGGETCAPTNQNDCAKSEARLAYHHYTYLNSLYHPDVLTKWDTQGCMDDITKNLGYRLKLNSVGIQSSAAVDGELYVSLDIDNLGYAAPSRERALNLVLRNTSTLVEYVIPFDADVRTWHTGNNVINESLTVPSTVPSGATYDLFLSMPDAASSLATDPNYSIQFANTGTWEASSGYNDLGISTTITASTTPSTPVIAVDGSLTDWVDVAAIGYGSGSTVSSIKAYDSADELFISASGTLGDGFNLYIDADGADYTGYLGWAEGAEYKVTGGTIYRFDYDESWVSIGSVTYVQNASAFEVQIAKNLLYGLGTNVRVGYEDLTGTTSNGQTPAAGNLFDYELNTVTTVERPPISITADASSSDWIYVDPLFQKTDGTINLLKVFDDETDVYVMVKGAFTAANPHQIFLDTDGNGATGFLDLAAWESMGADYAYLTNVFYEHTGASQTEYTWTSLGALAEVTATTELTTREYVFPKSSLNIPVTTSYVGLGYRELDATQTEVEDKVPDSGGLLRYSLESEYVPNLSSMTLTDDDTDLTITVLGNVLEATYDAFIDADNDAATGYSGGSVSGADFYISAGIIYSYSGVAPAWDWTATTGLTVTDGTGSREFNIAKSTLGLTASATTINVLYQNTVNFTATDVLPSSGMQSYVTTTGYVPNLSSMTLTDDATNLTITVLGSVLEATYESFIDIDNNAATGYSGGSISGADFYISSGVIYSYSGVAPAWGWTTTTGLTVTDGTGSRAFEIVKTDLGLTAAGTTINVLYQNTVNFAATDVLPTSGMQSYVTKIADGANLSSMTLTDDATDLTITVLGSVFEATYDAFIDIDNDAATGYSSGSVSGADFYISAGIIYSYSGVAPAWGWTATTGVTVTDGTGSREFEIAKSTLGLTTSGTTINVLYQNTVNFTATDVIPGFGMLSYSTTTDYVPNLSSMTLTDDATNLTITVLGNVLEATYESFIDIDNNAATGYSGGSISGADFYISSGVIYSYSGIAPAWGWTATTGLTVTDATGSREFEIAKTALSLTAAGTTINVLYQNTVNFVATDVLPTSGMQSYVTTTAYGANLSSMTLTDDATDLTITVLGSVLEATYESFIDIDNDAATGYSAGSISGADFYISAGIIYSYSGVAPAWGWTAETGLTVTDATGSREFEIDRTTLGLTASGTTINVLYQNTVNFVATDVIPSSGMQSYVTTTTYVPNLSSMTLTDDPVNLKIEVLGNVISSTYDAFIDVDNDAATGYSGGSISGADFYISAGIIYSYSGVAPAWGWTAATGLTVTDGAGSREFEISRSALGLNASGATINVLYQNTENFAATDILPASGMQSYVTTTSTTVATLYKHCSFGGYDIELAVGSYTMADLQALGMTDDDVSGVEVVDGYKIKMYQNDNFSGSTLIRKVDDNCFINDSFNDRVSSVVVEVDDSVEPVTLYKHCSYGGYALELSLGSYTLSDLQTLGMIDNDLSALQVESGYKVYLYQDDNFGGNVRIKRANDNCLINDGFNDAISSVQVVVADDAVVTIYKHCNYGGYAVELEVGSYSTADLQSLGLTDDDVSSVKIADGYEVIMYDQDNYLGTSLTKSADDNCFIDDSFNDKVSSVTVQATTGARIASDIEQEESVEALEEEALADEPLEYNVYPNPVSENLNISYHITQQGPVYFEIYGANGRRYFVQQEWATEGNHVTTITISDIPKGLAILRFNIQGQLYTNKLIIK